MPTLPLLTFWANQVTELCRLSAYVTPIPSGSPRTAKGNSTMLLVIFAGIHGWEQEQGGGGGAMTVSSTLFCFIFVFFSETRFLGWP